MTCSSLQACCYVLSACIDVLAQTHTHTHTYTHTLTLTQLHKPHM